MRCGSLCCCMTQISHHISSCRITSQRRYITSHRTASHDDITETRQAARTHGCGAIEQSHWTYSSNTCHKHVHRHNQTCSTKVETSAHVHRCLRACTCHAYLCMYVCVRVSACVYMCVSACVFVCVCVCAGLHGGCRHKLFSNTVQSMIEFHAWQVLRYDPK